MLLERKHVSDFEQVLKEIDFNILFMQMPGTFRQKGLGSLQTWLHGYYTSAATINKREQLSVSH